MQDEIFTQGLEEIYASHGKALPTQKVSAAIYDRIHDLPDGFMAFAVDELKDYATLSLNLGRELRVVLWPAYLGKNPQLRAHTSVQGCDVCRNSRAGVGFLYAHNPDDPEYPNHTVLRRCVCNLAPSVAHLPATTLQMIRDAGYVPGLPPLQTWAPQ